jgi:insertion element IS1 protein InsB
LSLDVKTREIVGVHIGDQLCWCAERNRSREGAKQLWQSLPSVYRQCAVCYSDFWEAYEQVIPSKRHRAVGKETGKTNYIERFNCTLRQRVSRLVRKTLSFSKKIEREGRSGSPTMPNRVVENHLGAIWYFVHYYNASLHL